MCAVETSAVDFIIFIFCGGGSGGVKLRYYLQGNKGASALESWQDLLGRDEGDVNWEIVIGAENLLSQDGVNVMESCESPSSARDQKWCEDMPILTVLTG